MLRQRIISAACMLLALFAAAFLLPSAGILFLIMALGFLGSLEYARLLRHASITVFTKTMLAGGLLISAAAYLDLHGNGRGGLPALPPFSWEIGALLFCLIMIALQSLRREPGPALLISAAATLLGLVYLPFLLNFHMRLALMEFEPAAETLIKWRVPALFPIVVVKVSDMGAYFSGRHFGGAKLCPRLSPGKTWSGFGGGLATAMLVAVCFAYFIKAPAAVLQPLWQPLPLSLCGVLLALVGAGGDLFESFLKRATAVKDSSGVLPGMGGLLDVLDSLLFSAPIFYIMIRIATASYPS